MNNNCQNCNHCQKLYRLFMCRYYKDKRHYCNLKDCITTPTDTCAGWQKKQCEYDISVERINKVLKDVQYIIDNLDEIQRQNF